MNISLQAALISSSLRSRYIWRGPGISLGNSVTNMGKNAVSIFDGEASGEESFSFNGNATKYRSIAINGNCYGNSSTSLLATANADFSNAFCSGTSNAEYSLAIGSNSISNGYSSIAIGNNVVTNGFASIGFGGANLIVNGDYSQVIGSDSSSEAPLSIAIGRYARADRVGIFTRSNHTFGNPLGGDQQHVTQILANKTTGVIPSSLLPAQTGFGFSIPNNKSLFAEVSIVGVKSDGTKTCSFTRQLMIKNEQGTTQLVGPVKTLDQDESSGTSVEITADDENDTLKIEVTGLENETWRWIAELNGVEVEY